MLIDPGWAARTPEVNDLLLKGGTGPGTTLAALAATVAEIASCEATAGVSVANMMATSADFVGASGLASAAKSTTINTITHLLAAWLTPRPALLTTAVDAFTLAYSTMVSAALCEQNRVEWGTAMALNSVFPPFFMPDIVRADTQYYGHFWTNNSGCGAGYSAVLVGLLPALALPLPITPPGASPAAPATAAGAVAEATATGTAGDAMRASSAAANETLSAGTGGTQNMASFAQQAIQPLQQGIEAVPKAFEGLLGLPMQMAQPAMSAMQSFTGMLGGASPGAGTQGAAEALRAGAGGGGVGLGPTAGIGGGGGVGSGSLSSAGQGLTSYTRPVSGFASDSGGRPTGLRSAGLLSAAESRLPTTTSGMGGSAMPMAPHGMLGHGKGENHQDEITRARIVVKGDRAEQD